MIKNRTLRLFFSPIKQHYILCKFKNRWRQKNGHNKTRAVNQFPIEKVSVGNDTYGDLQVYAFGGQREYLKIGNYCSLAGNVVFILGGEHSTKMVSTFPFARHVYNIPDNPDEATKGPIIVGDDVWIGHGAIILSGVTIGQGAVIGAGSVVTKNVPPYAIFVNGSVKKYRFSEEIIEKLVRIDFSKLNHDEFSKMCTQEVTNENIDKILQVFE